MTTDQLFSSATSATIAVVQTSANGQLCPRSALFGWLPGQHWIIVAMSIPTIASVRTAPEDAMALPAVPMLIGPTMSPSKATSSERR
ncbi:hypothetical protein AB4Z52_03975 [Rhizobium sp. 2YAF20]|uniref:hypothetical protein n=1 Tax=Rhizobium sp. 2YAF20 TaxID=3233027 RepID=UPI003F997F77